MFFSYKSQKKGGKSLSSDRHWHEKIEKYLNTQLDGAKYKRVERVVMGSMAIAAWVREDKVHFLLIEFFFFFSPNSTFDILIF